MSQRGRPKKYKWFLLKDLNSEYSSGAQYLKWASSNNTALQTIASTGCPRCQSKNVEFRHDQKYMIIRFHCIECRHETSYKIKPPNPGSIVIIPFFYNGIQIGEKIVDHYHPATKRQRSDALIIMVSRGIEGGKYSLGGEWYVDGRVGGIYSQKRYYSNFDEITITCNWNKMQAEHENRLRKLEEDIAV
ncbi:MAG: hypothetical protein JSV05_09945 [Candidatus Bathyarchaeota archaeon]|nr:MAG: hypothetical protein JSV05_09945 [Candidatus Bathyarchaeota archaeon]